MSHPPHGGNESPQDPPAGGGSAAGDDQRPPGWPHSGGDPSAAAPDGPGTGSTTEEQAWASSPWHYPEDDRTGAPADQTTAFAGPPVEPAPPAEPHGAARPARRRRTMLIVSVVLGALVVLCGGGGLAAYLLLRNSEPGPGAADPATAVDGLLTAVYTDQDADRAAELVCSEARDQAKIARKVDEVKGYGKTYQSPKFSWADPQVAPDGTDRAAVTVTVTMTTLDEKTAEQPLRFTVLKKDSGWRVCEVAG